MAGNGARAANVRAGRRRLSAHAVLPGLNWLYGWDVTDCCPRRKYPGQYGGGRRDERRVPRVCPVVDHRLHACRIGRAYTEWFVIVPAGAESVQTEHYGDAGLTFRLTNDLQLDVRIGKGFSGNAVDYFAGAGLVVRL